MPLVLSSQRYYEEKLSEDKNERVSTLVQVLKVGNGKSSSRRHCLRWIATDKCWNKKLPF